MSEITRMTQSIAPARHRMSLKDRFKDNVARVHEAVKPPEPKHRRQRRMHLSLGMSALSLAALFGFSAQAEPAPADSKPAIVTNDQQEALTTKRYDKCAVKHITTQQVRQGGYRVTVEWSLQPNTEINTTLQQYQDRDDITIGPTRPVVRPFGVDENGSAIVGKPLGERFIDTHGRMRDIPEFSAWLPEPRGGIRYALSVGNEIAYRNSEGTVTRAYGEQQCAELVWRVDESSGRAEWISQPPDPSLLEQQRYAVKN